MMRISGPWLDRSGTQQALGLLENADYQGLLVGGCVRDALLGRPVGDIDIATDARPETVLALADAAGLRAIPTGMDHGTVTLIVDGAPHEITTFRRDVQTDGRHAVVRFSDRIEDDARRRDFTMNALYATRAGQVFDPIDGLHDLFARRVRFIGDAAQRIAEDHLRILRFFRFQAWFGDPAEGPDADALAACAEAAEGLEQLSRERIGAEMLKLLAAPDPAPALATMEHTGVLARILPGAGTAALPVLIHLEEGEVSPAPLRRLALLGGEDVAARLRLSRAQSRALRLLTEAIAQGEGPGALAYRHGAEVATDTVLLRAAMAGQPLPDGWREEIDTGAAAEFPLSAADLMPTFSGPALGARLSELESRWIASGFTLSRDDLLAAD